MKNQINSNFVPISQLSLTRKLVTTRRTSKVESGRERGRWTSV